jgi:hypothetical protein
MLTIDLGRGRADPLLSLYLRGCVAFRRMAAMASQRAQFVISTCPRSPLDERANRRSGASQRLS